MIFYFKIKFFACSFARIDIDISYFATLLLVQCMRCNLLRDLRHAKLVHTKTRGRTPCVCVEIKWRSSRDAE